MTDDIVTRLQRAFEIWLSHGEVDDLAWSVAADEIERLRAELVIANNTLIYYSLKTLTALKDLHKQVGDTISWGHLNELYEMKGFITR